MFRKRFPMQWVAYASRAKKTSLNWNGNAPFGAALPLRISVFYLRRNNGTATSPNRDGKMQTQRNHTLERAAIRRRYCQFLSPREKTRIFLCLLSFRICHIEWVSERARKCSSISIWIATTRQLLLSMPGIRTAQRFVYSRKAYNAVVCMPHGICDIGFRISNSHSLSSYRVHNVLVIKFVAVIYDRRNG